MKRLHLSLEQPVAFVLALVMTFSFCAQAAPAQQVSPPSSQSSTTSSDSSNGSQSNQLPSGSSPDESSVSSTQSTQQEPVATGAQRNSNPPATGTALAPYEKQNGVTGSKPAGAAIAPGKQRRTRSFAIRAALLVGAAIAIGVVVGASMGSPARAN